MTPEVLSIYDGKINNYRIETGVLGIRTGNFASEEYLDENGAEMRRATAGLWLILRGRPETSSFQRVYGGQEIEYQGRRIRVLAVGSDHRGMYVKMEVENTK